MKSKIINILVFLLLFIGCDKSEMDISNNQDVATDEILIEADLVFNLVAPIFNQSDNIEEMENQLDDIVDLEQVEKAWRCEEAIFAKLRCGMTIFWYFPPEENFSSEYVNTRALTALDSLINNEMMASRDNNKPILATNMEICFINQYANEKYKIQPEINKSLSEKAQTLRKYGYGVREVIADQFTLEFMSAEFDYDKPKLYDYNMVFLFTHGLRDDTTGVQYILTGVDPKTKSDYILDQMEKAKSSGKGLTFYVMIGDVKDKYAGKPKDFIAVSEHWLEENLGYFPDNSLMFCSACSSLKGTGSLYDNALAGKNLGVYFGFDNEVNRRFAIEKSFDMLTSLMVCGSTAQGAYDLLDEEYKKFEGTKLLIKKRTPNMDVCMCDAVDMGLSVMWGTRDLGSMTPFRLGDFYKWGDIEVAGYNTEYKFWEDEDRTLVKFIGNEISGNEKYDPVTVLLGEPWRMPTKEECDELINNCTIVNVANNEMVGMTDWISSSWGGVLMVSNKRMASNISSSIYLPYYWNSLGSYWTGTFSPDDPSIEMYLDAKNKMAYCMEVNEPTLTGTPGLVKTIVSPRMWNANIRPVYDPR